MLQVMAIFHLGQCNTVKKDVKSSKQEWGRLLEESEKIGWRLAAWAGAVRDWLGKGSLGKSFAL